MAEIKINKDDWASISEEEQEKITQGLQQCGSIGDEDIIVGAEDVESFDPDQLIEIKWNPMRDLCLIACDTAAGTAAAWCTANTAGAGLVVCLAAAEAARRKCREGC